MAKEIDPVLDTNLDPAVREAIRQQRVRDAAPADAPAKTKKSNGDDAGK